MTNDEIVWKYGPVEGDWLVQQLATFWEKAADQYDCVDNVRLARVGDTNDEEQYDESKREGCCGFEDVTFGPSPGGHTYNFGFNYGH